MLEAKGKLDQSQDYLPYICTTSEIKPVLSSNYQQLESHQFQNSRWEIPIGPSKQRTIQNGNHVCVPVCTIVTVLTHDMYQATPTGLALQTPSMSL